MCGIRRGWSILNINYYYGWNWWRENDGCSAGGG
jgi:hypothetical protein